MSTVSFLVTMQELLILNTTASHINLTTIAMVTKQQTFKI